MNTLNCMLTPRLTQLYNPNATLIKHNRIKTLFYNGSFTTTRIYTHTSATYCKLVM